MHAMMKHDDYEIQVTADIDDETMATKEVADMVYQYPKANILYGTSANKIDAINRDMPLFQDWDILVNMSDDMFGYIYNPEYKSLFCDNEQQEVAKLLGRYVYIKKRLFNHNHPAWGLAAMDALMVHTESFHMEDKATFERRKAINFGI